jgi:23S rRNA (cytosine1962-C5)-methyltransferase
MRRPSGARQQSLPKRAAWGYDTPMPSNRPRRKPMESLKGAKRRGDGRTTGADSHSPRALSPDPAQPLPAVFLKTPTFHPIIYRKRTAKIDAKAKAGDLVAVYHGDDELLGYGVYNSRSEIAVRMVRLGSDLPDDAFWQQRLQEAVRLRRDVLGLDAVTDAYRVLHAEADGFSGLVVDKLGDTLSAEAFSLGMFQRAGEILTRLAPLVGTRHTLIQTGPQSLAQEGFAADPMASPELPKRVTIQEFGTRFRVKLEGGHKTGFFCDQRDNRRRLAEFCGGKSVLDLCCYTGGFAVQAKRLGNAADVTGVDLDETPLALARENANLNQARVNFVQADVFAYMRDMLRGGRQYDVVVLDPPKLITNRAEIEEGTRKHFDLNRLAMQLVRPGGILLSCSCAGLLPESEFVRLLYAAARQAVPRPAEGELPRSSPGRVLQVLFTPGAAADHPVASNCPETEYLKAVWMRVT